MKKIILALLLICSSAVAQKLPDFGFNKVRIVQADKVIQAELIPVTTDPSLETTKTYYWCSSNVIHATQGGFSGKLLNGDYTEYYINKELKENGQFKRGLKDGVWKSWDDSGNLIQYYTWKKGVKDGTFKLFEVNGKLRQTGEYDNDLLNGPVKTYTIGIDTATTVYYKNGAVIKKPLPFYKQLPIFKRNHKTPKETTGKAKSTK